MRSRGLEVPPELILDIQVSLATGDYPAGTSLATRALGALVRRLNGLDRPLR